MGTIEESMPDVMVFQTNQGLMNKPTDSF